MPRFVANVGESYYFPIGIAYISAAMKQAGFNVFTLNLNHIEGEIGEILDSEIVRNKINVVLTGGLSVQCSILKNIIDCIHKGFQRIKIIVGGGIITGDPVPAMKALEYVDVGVIGEGEQTIVELCDALQNEEEISEIAGIIYMNNENWTQTKTRKEIGDLNSIPFPDHDGFELKKYLELKSMTTGNTSKEFLVLSSRSCPYQCTFCFRSVGKKYRQRSMDSVIKEIEMLVEKYGVKHIRMSDELFARSKEKIQIMKEVSKKLGITWEASFRVDDIDDDMIEIIKHSNCTHMNFGLESANNKILQSMRKHITVEQIEKTLKLVYDSGVPFHGNFIFGDIEETFETANATLDWWEKHAYYNTILYFIIVYPGTYLYRHALQKGIIKNPVQFLKDNCPQINVSKMSEDEISLIAKRMLTLPVQASLQLKEMDDILIDDCGSSISYNGECLKCGKKQRFNNMKLFANKTWSICVNCGQKHTVKLPEKLTKIFLINLQNYLNKNNKVGLWGITSQSLSLFEENDIFKNENIVFLDNASAKQMIKIHDKKVYSPSILIENEIQTVIFFYPSLYTNFVADVKQKYPEVKDFINCYDLLKGKKMSINSWE